MPAFDGTGPLGQGPLTGRGLGPCGAGMAWRRGWGRGLGRYYFGWRWPQTKEDQKKALADYKKSLEEELEEVKKEEAELSKRE